MLAKHRDRYRISEIDPADSDLPVALGTQLEKISVGGTATVRIAAGLLSATLIDRTSEPAQGYLSAMFALKQGIGAQAELTPLESLAEPYVRPHSNDADFYATPRLVSHLDSAAAGAWTTFTERFVSPGMHVLDLMASCDSHLSAHVRPEMLVGIGMNAQELANNPALTGHIVHDLNSNLHLPCNTGTFDLVLCALSIEYLARPEAVLAEVQRCLRPGGRCIISFSERWFPPKIVAPWPVLTPFARVAWVLRHLQRSGFTDLHTESLRGLPRPIDDKHIQQTSLADPLYAAWGTV